MRPYSDDSLIFPGAPRGARAADLARPRLTSGVVLGRLGRLGGQLAVALGAVEHGDDVAE